MPVPEETVDRLRLPPTESSPSPRPGNDSKPVLVSARDRDRLGDADAGVGDAAGNTGAAGDGDGDGDSDSDPNTDVESAGSVLGRAKRKRVGEAEEGAVLGRRRWALLGDDCEDIDPIGPEGDVVDWDISTGRWWWRCLWLGSIMGVE